MGDSEPDRRSDIYSLGCVAYFLVTGRPPFEADKPLKVILAHAHQTLVPPSQHVPSLPDDFEGIILRCLAKRPDERYQTIEELAEALESCLDAGSWRRDDAQRWWQERHHPSESSPALVPVS